MSEAYALLLVVVIGLLISRSDHDTAHPNNLTAEVKPEPRYDPPPRPVVAPPVAVPKTAASVTWLEDATVFIKLKVGQSLAGNRVCDSRQRRHGMIAANRHVVMPDLDEDEGKPKIKVVFRSGKGAGRGPKWPPRSWPLIPRRR